MVSPISPVQQFIAISKLDPEMEYIEASAQSIELKCYAETYGVVRAWNQLWSNTAQTVQTFYHTHIQPKLKTFSSDELEGLEKSLAVLKNKCKWNILEVEEKALQSHKQQRQVSTKPVAQIDFDKLEQAEAAQLSAGNNLPLSIAEPQSTSYSVASTHSSQSPEVLRRPHRPHCTGIIHVVVVKTRRREWGLRRTFASNWARLASKMKTEG